MARGTKRRNSMGRRAVNTWCEQDAFTRWRELLAYLGRAGVAKSIKQGSNRYERRVLKRRDIEERLHDD